ncbi:MAG TPA: flagellar hook-associated protein FlgK [Caulobacteraceae bacterium]|jgi:flagellar hook-associated protein 1 FlgK
MSLTSIFNIATSGMRVAQTGLRTTSDNISNVNTEGFTRRVVDQQAIVIDGAGAGVEVARIRRAADIYLQRSSLSASSETGRATMVAEFLDHAQSLFGDPSTSESIFSGLDEVFTAFSAAGSDPASQLRRNSAITAVQDFFTDAKELSAELNAIRDQTNTHIASVVDRANGLLREINDLNIEISRFTITGRDPTGAENAQSRLVQELSGLINFQMTQREHGGVTLRTAEGVMLAGDGAATIAFDRSNSAGASLMLVPAQGSSTPLTHGLNSGELKGLLQMRDEILPGLSAQFGEFTTRAADALNRAHNASSAVPAPTVLQGRQTGLALDTSIAGFTGRTSIMILETTGAAAGTVRRRIDIDFGAGPSINGVATTPANFLTDLDTVLGADGGGSFTAGVLTLTGEAGGGVAIVDDPTQPSSRAGRGFSHYFGLNDLVRSTSTAFLDTGLRGTDRHDFPNGSTVKFRLHGEAGSHLTDVTATVPSPPNTMNAFIGALNTSVSGYGAFALDAHGGISFTPAVGREVTISVLEDQTAHTTSGLSATLMFGLDANSRGARAQNFVVNPAILADPKKLALAQVDPTAVVGSRELVLGDSRGAHAIAAAGESAIHFDKAGDGIAVDMALSRYGAEFGGAVGRKAANAQRRQEGAELLQREADARRSGAEGVNLDEELIQLTVYQQSFNASARLIQAAKEMYDTLINIV